MTGWMIFASCVVVLTSVGCGSSGAGASGAIDSAVARDRAAIDSLRVQYQATWKAGNAEQLAVLYAPNALVLYPNQPAIAGRAAIRSYFETFFAAFAQDVFELTSEEVHVAGSWAFDRGTVRWRGAPRSSGPPLEDQGKYLVILQRQPDGSWKVARDMDNSDRPLAQTTAALPNKALQQTPQTR